MPDSTPTGWRPIESAPFDTHVLVCWTWENFEHDIDGDIESSVGIGVRVSRDCVDEHILSTLRNAHRGHGFEPCWWPMALWLVGRR